VREIAEATPEGYTRTNRPYPGGGACYELELYLAVNVCEGLLPGLYHYCPKKHQLSKLSGRTPEVERLLERAYYAADERGTPQVLIILAARFQRASWKYSAMAYATVLKNVGVLYQTMYLVATAMGLAPCALGGGDSDVFVAATGGDYYAETSVGEFLLGSQPS
jgi:SagB-type dehydrogenase family enzyme